MDITPITNKINIIFGTAAAILSYIFGHHWFLFLAFILLNAGDYVSRWIAARLTGTESSNKAWHGILKKMGYWLMIALSFGMSALFIEIGKTIGINLGVTELLGWFVLASLSINEIRSILENLYDAGLHVPIFLTKGLEVANKVMNSVEELGEKEEPEE